MSTLKHGTCRNRIICNHNRILIDDPVDVRQTEIAAGMPRGIRG